MPEENSFSGEPVESSATDTPANVSDNDSQSETVNVWEAIEDGTYNADPVTEDPASEEVETVDVEEDADETIPAEDEDETETGDQAKDEEKPKNRAQNYKDLQTENQTVKDQLTTTETELQQLNEKVSKLDETLEIYGGVEQIGNFIENQNKFIDPARYSEAVDYVLTLPQAPVIVSEVLNRSFNLGDVTLDEAQAATAINNRVEIVNSALAKDFNLAEKLSGEEMTRIFEYIAVRANADKSDLFDDINDAIAILSPETENSLDPETQKRIEELEKQIQEQKAGETTAKQDAIDPANIAKTLDDFEAGVIEEVAAEVLKDYSKTLATLPPLQAKAIKALIRMELGAGKTFVDLADYIVKDKRTHENATFLQGQYKNDVKKLFRGIAVEFLGKPLSIAPGDQAAKTTTTKQPGLTGKTKGSIKPPPAKKEKESAWAEFMN